MSIPLTIPKHDRNIRWIVVHCTATNQRATVDAIQNYWRTKLKWRRPGYHYLVAPDGRIFTLLEERWDSNGVRGFNKNSVHISYIGGIDAQGKPKDNRTPHQKNALRVALKILKERYPNAIIQGHRDFPNVSKACPSFDAKTEYADM